MKVFFKHAEGFLNIDNENFYFTSNGVWSYALSLKEESDLTINLAKQKITFKNSLVSFFIHVMQYAMILFYLYVFTNNWFLLFLEAKFSLLNTFLIIFFYYSFILSLIIHRYFFSNKKPVQVEIEEKMFKTPKHKIQHIFLEDDNMYIVFTNMEGTLKSILLKKFAVKGIYSKSFFENI